MKIKHRSTEAEKAAIEAWIAELCRRRGIPVSSLYVIVPSLRARMTP